MSANLFNVYFDVTSASSDSRSISFDIVQIGAPRLEVNTQTKGGTSSTVDVDMSCFATQTDLSSAMSGVTVYSGVGTSGLVPSASSAEQYLRGDGTWNGYATTSAGGLMSSVDKTSLNGSLNAVSASLITVSSGGSSHMELSILTTTNAGGSATINVDMSPLASAISSAVISALS